MNAPIWPPIHTCIKLWGVDSSCPIIPGTRCHEGSVLVWPVGRVLINASKFGSPRIVVITVEPTQALGSESFCDFVRVASKSGLGSPLKIGCMKVAGIWRLAVQSQ